MRLFIHPKVLPKDQTILEESAASFSIKVEKDFSLSEKFSHKEKEEVQIIFLEQESLQSLPLPQLEKWQENKEKIFLYVILSSEALFKKIHSHFNHLLSGIFISPLEKAVIEETFRDLQEFLPEDSLDLLSTPSFSQSKKEEDGDMLEFSLDLPDTPSLTSQRELPSLEEKDVSSRGDLPSLELFDTPSLSISPSSTSVSMSSLSLEQEATKDIFLPLKENIQEKEKEKELEEGEEDFKNTITPTIPEMFKENKESKERVSSSIKMDFLRQENDSLKRQYLETKTELEGIKFEFSVSKKLHLEELEEFKYLLRLADEKFEVLKEKYKKAQEEIKRLQEKRVNTSHQQKEKEVELENKLELLQGDYASQLKLRDQKILELKRALDLSEIMSKSAKDQETLFRVEYKKMEQKYHRFVKELEGLVKEAKVLEVSSYWEEESKDIA